MSYFYRSTDKDAVKAFIYEDLKVLGIKIPKLDKIAKAQQQHSGRIASGCQPESQQRQGSMGDRPIFGVPIHLMECVEDINIGHIPQFLIHTRHFLSKHLDKEGLFRKTGSVSRQKDLAQYIEEHGGAYMEDAQVYDVTSVVKQFFRAMPEPIIPHILQDAFVQAIQLDSENSKVYSLALLCLLMPCEHLSVFRYTLEMLSDVSCNSELNKMTTHNLAVCLTPNMFHTKADSKLIHQQTEAIEICIANVINIGVIPPSITEKVVILNSLEANEMGSVSSMESNTTNAGNPQSHRKKKRSGSLQGGLSMSFVGSIRRSVEKLRTKASRRSASVPENLNIMNEADFGPRETRKSADGAESNAATPQILRKVASSDTATAFSLRKRRAIMDQSSLLGTPLMKMSLHSYSTDNVFDSPSLLLPDNTTLSSFNSTNATNVDSVRTEASNKKKSWSSLRSPFSKRRRSLSAGPFSPLASQRARSSSRTKKLIRRLSGGKKKTPDMVGQRMAFTNEDDVASVRQRMPSAPTSLRLRRSSDGGEDMDDGEMCNKEFMKALRADLLTNDASPVLDDTDNDLRPITRLHTMRESRRQRAPIRKRAMSADARTLKRGRPNHPVTGLTRIRIPAKTENTHPSIESLGLISNPMEITAVESNANLIDLQEARAMSVRPPQGLLRSTHQSDDAPLETAFSTEFEISVASQLGVPGRQERQIVDREADQFNARMTKVAQRHSAMFTDKRHSAAFADKPPIPRQESMPSVDSDREEKKLPQRAATFSGNNRVAAGSRSFSQRPPRPEKPNMLRKQLLDLDRGFSVTATDTSSQYNVNLSGVMMSGLGDSEELLVRTDSRISSVRAGSKSSLKDTDSGVSLTSLNSRASGSANEVKLGSERRVVIGGNDESEEAAYLMSRGETAEKRVSHRNQLTVRGAAILSSTHADSITNLQDARKVKQSKLLFDQQEDGSEERPISGVVDMDRPITSDRRLSAKPPRQAPVRIPTVFAKNDPRAMRYKMAADAVRRRSLQKADNHEKASSFVTPRPDNSENGDCSPSNRPRSKRGSSKSLKGAELPGSESNTPSRSLKFVYSPPRQSELTPSRQRHSSRAVPHIPISTDLVRGVGQLTASPSFPAKTLSLVVTNDRLPLRDHSPNVELVPTNTPKIKSAMMPLDQIRKAVRHGETASARCKSPKSHISSRHRLTPYSTRSPARVTRDSRTSRTPSKGSNRPSLV